jgi:hypothetical protein
MAAWAPRPVIVASKTMPAAVLAAAEETDDAGFGQSPVDLETPGGEFSGDGAGGSGLLEGGLRVLADASARLGSYVRRWFGWAGAGLTVVIFWEYRTASQEPRSKTRLKLRAI